MVGRRVEVGSAVPSVVVSFGRRAGLGVWGVALVVGWSLWGNAVIFLDKVEWAP